MQAASRSGRRGRRVSIARALAFAASTRRISPGRSRSSGRIRLRFRALTARPRLLQKRSRVLRSGAAIAPGKETFLAEADKIAADLSRHAIRQGPSAAWIGLDWLGDSEVAQLVPLGADLYNGLSGIALFLAAHAAVSGEQAFKGAGAGGGRASAQEPERPQRSAHGAIPGHRRRHRAGLDRLCARGDGEVSARTMTCSRTRMRRRTCSATT